jgi:hypothetical protein
MVQTSVAYRDDRLVRRFDDFRFIRAVMQAQAHFLL